MGTLPCGQRTCTSIAYAINNQGIVVGGSTTIRPDGLNVTEHAVMWRSGQLTDLNGLGGTSSKARGINSKGQIVGDATLAGDLERHAFLWAPPTFAVGGVQLDGGMQDLGRLGCNSAGCHTAATGISDKGAVAGQGLVAGEAWHALVNVEKDGTRVNVDLGIIDPPSERTPAPCSGPCNSMAHAVNSAGQIVGMSGGAPFLYQPGEEPNMSEAKPFQISGGAAFDIDESGTAVGEARIKPVEPGHNPPSHAYYGSTDLKTLATDSDHAESRAYAINDGTFGQPTVVGESRTDSGATHAFVWTGGQMRDLNTLIPQDSGWVLRTAYGVNDRGWIVGSGTYNGVQRGFILTPGSSACTQAGQSAGAPIRPASYQAAAACTVPVIFIPGVMGTELKCGNSTIWPRVLPWGPNLRRLMLRPDGKTSVESCVKPGNIIKKVAGQDIYGTTLQGLEALPGAKIYPFPYDWRMSPGDAVPALNRLVDQALAETKADKVVIYAHSMGGLVARWYVDDAERASKVDRVLTVGTPYLGSPKSWFALAHGYSTPTGDIGLDALLSNGPLKELARNLTGLYFLYPDRQFVKHRTWLYIRGNPRLGATLKEAGVLQAVGEYGGNKDLLKSAWDARDRHLTGFSVHGVDYQLMIGLKLPSFVEIDETHMGDGRPLFTGVKWQTGDGDGTVPAFSAQAQADPRMVGPAPVPIHIACGVDHQSLAGNAEVLARSRDFLLTGKPILPPPAGTACP
ncbi:alpha/beta fold hydrolase [Streptomyces chartreusis]